MKFRARRRFRESTERAPVQKMRGLISILTEINKSVKRPRVFATPQSGEPYVSRKWSEAKCAGRDAFPKRERVPNRENDMIDKESYFQQTSRTENLKFLQ